MVMYPNMNKDLQIITLYANNIVPAPLSTYSSSGYSGFDIAASISGSCTIANVVMRQSNSTPIEYLKVDMSFPTGVPSVPFTLNPGIAYDPRIEAFGISNIAPGMANWAIAAREGLQKIVLYTGNSSFGYHCNPSQYNPSSGPTQEHATIAAGIGPVSSNVGNKQYIYAWGDPSKNRYLAQSLDVNGIPITPDSAYEVNNSPCSIVNDPSDLISMSNSCNSGYGTLSAWNGGGRIYYKLLNNNYRFRPTGVEEIKALPAFDIYPNPASEYVTIKNAEPIGQLSIINSMGTQVFRESYASSQAKVDVSHLASGIYYIRIVGKSGISAQQRLTINR